MKVTRKLACLTPLEKLTASITSFGEVCFPCVCDDTVHDVNFRQGREYEKELESPGVFFRSFLVLTSPNQVISVRFQLHRCLRQVTVQRLRSFRANIRSDSRESLHPNRLLPCASIQLQQAPRTARFTGVRIRELPPVPLRRCVVGNLRCIHNHAVASSLSTCFLPLDSPSSCHQHSYRSSFLAPLSYRPQTCFSFETSLVASYQGTFQPSDAAWQPSVDAKRW